MIKLLNIRSILLFCRGNEDNMQDYSSWPCEQTAFGSAVLPSLCGLYGCVGLALFCLFWVSIFMLWVIFFGVVLLG